MKQPCVESEPIRLLALTLLNFFYPLRADPECRTCNAPYPCYGSHARIGYCRISPGTVLCGSAFYDGFTAASERFKNKSEADTVSKACNGSVAVATKTECKKKSEKPPALYDLISLQRDANRVLGFTAQQTLDYTRNLYEKKLVTYPRTDSKFLTEDIAHSLPDLVKMAFHAFLVDSVENVPVNTSQVINNKKVIEHHAISRTSAYNLVKKKAFHSVRIGGSIRISKKSFD